MNREDRPGPLEWCMIISASIVFGAAVKALALWDRMRGRPVELSLKRFRRPKR